METMDKVEETKDCNPLVEGARKAAFAVVGAPVIATRRLGSLTGKWRQGARVEFEKWVAEGERLTTDLRQGKLVEDIKEKVDFDQLQGRVEKLRDQLEEVLANWRASFKPEKADAAVEPKTAAKKTTASAKAGAADKASA